MVEQYDLKGNVTASISTEYDPDFKLNTPVDDDSLSLHLPPGTEVHNRIVDAEYTIP